MKVSIDGKPLGFTSDENFVKFAVLDDDLRISGVRYCSRIDYDNDPKLRELIKIVNRLAKKGSNAILDDSWGRGVAASRHGSYCKKLYKYAKKHGIEIYNCNPIKNHIQLDEENEQ